MIQLLLDDAIVTCGENILLKVALSEFTFKEFSPLRTVEVSFVMVTVLEDLVQLLATGAGLVLTLMMDAEPSNPPSKPRKEFVCALLRDGHTSSNNAAMG
jgi:hypothetical protein